MTTPNTYGLLLETVNRYGSTYVMARMVLREDGCAYPMNCSYDGESSAWGRAPGHMEGHQLFGLCMDGFISDTQFDHLGYEAVYRDIHTADLVKMRRMTKTLSKVVARVHRDKATEAGDYLVAFCKALKLDFVVEMEGTDKGSSYAANQWHWMSIEAGRNRYRQKISEAVAIATAKAKGRVA
jgi:hypothetical protein